MSKGFPAISGEDETPKKGFYIVILTVPDLKVKKHCMSKPTAQNASMQVDYQEDAVKIQVTVEKEGGEAIAYEYSKKMPENIVKDKCKCEWEEDQLKLVICKEKATSWARYTDYLTDLEIRKS